MTKSEESRIIDVNLTFVEAWYSLHHGLDVAFATWPDQSRIRIVNGYVVKIGMKRGGSISTWVPDPIEMMQDRWMTVK